MILDAKKLDKIKPCPFCGGEARLLHGSEGLTGTRTSFVKCGECGCRTSAFAVDARYSSDERVIEIWNKRDYCTDCEYVKNVD